MFTYQYFLANLFQCLTVFTFVRIFTTSHPQHFCHLKPVLSSPLSKCQKYYLPLSATFMCVEVMFAFLSKPFLTGRVFYASLSCHFPVANITSSVWRCHRFMCKISGAFAIPVPYNEIAVHKLLFSWSRPPSSVFLCPFYANGNK